MILVVLTGCCPQWNSWAAHEGQVSAVGSDFGDTELLTDGAGRSWTTNALLDASASVRAMNTAAPAAHRRGLRWSASVAEGVPWVHAWVWEAGPGEFVDEASLVDALLVRLDTKEELSLEYADWSGLAGLHGEGTGQFFVQGQAPSFALGNRSQQILVAAWTPDGFVTEHVSAWGSIGETYVVDVAVGEERRALWGRVVHEDGEQEYGLFEDDGQGWMSVPMEGLQGISTGSLNYAGDGTLVVVWLD